MNDTLSVVKQNKKSANEIETISGATITSRAVAGGVQVALDPVKSITEGDIKKWLSLQKTPFQFSPTEL